MRIDESYQLGIGVLKWEALIYILCPWFWTFSHVEEQGLFLIAWIGSSNKSLFLKNKLETSLSENMEG